MAETHRGAVQHQAGPGKPVARAAAHFQGGRHCQGQDNHSCQQRITPPAQVICRHVESKSREQPRQSRAQHIPPGRFCQPIDRERHQGIDHLAKEQYRLIRLQTAPKTKHRSDHMKTVMVIHRYRKIRQPIRRQSTVFNDLSHQQRMVNGIHPHRQSEVVHLVQTPGYHHQKGSGCQQVPRIKLERRPAQQNDQQPDGQDGEIKTNYPPRRNPQAGQK